MSYLGLGLWTADELNEERAREFKRGELAKARRLLELTRARIARLEEELGDG